MKNSSIKEREIIHIIEQQFNKFNSKDLFYHEDCFQITRDMIKSCTEDRIQKTILYNLLNTEIQLRKKWMVDAIVMYTQHYEFFKKYEAKHYECACFMKLAVFRRGSQIVQYQSDPDDFFFMLEGQSLIFLKKTGEEMEQQKIYKQNQSIILDQDHSLLSKKHFQSSICKFKKITSVKQGASFGELGIIYNRPRIAMIVAQTNCVLATLSKQYYLSIFCESENQQRKFKRDFIFQHFFAQFKSLKYQSCEAILYSFRQRRLRINEFLYKEGDKFQTLYLIKSGEAVISKTYEFKTKNISRVSQGYFLGYEQLWKALQNNEPGILNATAQVSSAYLVVYTLNFKEIQKFHNFKNILSENINKDISYIKYLERSDTAKLKTIVAPKKQQKPEIETLNKVEIEKQLKKLLLGTVLSSPKWKQKNISTFNNSKRCSLQFYPVDCPKAINIRHTTETLKESLKQFKNPIIKHSIIKKSTLRQI